MTSEMTGEKSGEITGREVAVVGLAGRFPGAAGVPELWRNLCAGAESIRVLTDDELRAAGVPDASLRDPRYVRARGALDGVDLFDAALFGFTPREAEILDPQQRLFLECAWEVLEEAGVDPLTAPGLIAVYAGVGSSTYLWNVLARRTDLDGLQALFGNEKDFLATQVSYRLNLRGPSLTVQTACSTSLVAVHLACQACSTTSATWRWPAASRRPCRRSAATSTRRAASCRPTAAAAPSTPAPPAPCSAPAPASSPWSAWRTPWPPATTSSPSSAARRSTTTAASRSATPRRAWKARPRSSPPPRPWPGWTPRRSPTSRPTARAPRSATRSRSPPSPRPSAPATSAQDERASAPWASVKPNIGHLDTAAGVAGFIKTVLALHHRRLPAALHFERANPEIDLASSPFYVTAAAAEWETDRLPRRAGVSAFGIGGTNAHVVLEEAPEPEPSGPSRPWQLLLLSARTPEALARRASESGRPPGGPGRSGRSRGRGPHAARRPPCPARPQRLRGPPPRRGGPRAGGRGDSGARLRTGRRPWPSSCPARAPSTPAWPRSSGAASPPSARRSTSAPACSRPTSVSTFEA